MSLEIGIGANPSDTEALPRLHREEHGRDSILDTILTCGIVLHIYYLAVFCANWC